MGHTIVTCDNSPLYGYKTDLKKRLRNGNVPDWLYTRDIDEQVVSTERWEKDRERAAERARSRREDCKESDLIDAESQKPYTRTVEYKVYTPQPSGVLVFGGGTMPGKNNPPSDIVEKLNVSIDEAVRRIGRPERDISARNYVVRIHVGVRGGIEDITMGRDFHH